MGQRRRSGGRPHRHATRLRFEANEPGERRRNAQGTSTVGSERQRRDAGCDGSRRARARSARRLRQIPGVARDPRQRQVPHGLAAELARCGLADHDGAGAPHAFDRRRVGGRSRVRHDARARAERRVLKSDQVLDGDWQAVQRAERIPAHHRGLGGASFGKRGLGAQMREGVQARLRGLRLVERAADEVHRRHLPGRDEAGRARSRSWHRSGSTSCAPLPHRTFSRRGSRRRGPASPSRP